MDEDSLGFMRNMPVANSHKETQYKLNYTGGTNWTEKTRELLHAFYTPFNIKLSELLENRWYLSWNKL